MSARFTLMLAALGGALAVLLGAFAAHGLRAQLSERLLEVFQTGVSYQFYHVFALLAVGLLQLHYRSRLLALSSAFFLLGILLFCGSLYVLAWSGIHWLGAVTPVGGVFFVLGWLTLLGTLFKKVNLNADTTER